MANASGWLKRTALTVAGLLLALLTLTLVALLYLDIPRNAAGMAAKGVCSATFVAGRPWRTLLADDVLPASPVLRLIRITVDENARSVTARFAGLFARQAVLLAQRGCVLDAEPPQAAKPALKPQQRKQQAGHCQRRAFEPAGGVCHGSSRSQSKGSL